MISSYAVVWLAGPAALITVFLLAVGSAGFRLRSLLDWARMAALGNFAAALAAAFWVALHGPVTSPLIGIGTIGLSLRLDALSVTMLLLVGFVSAIVVQFSRNYLDGDPRQGLFIGRLCLTVAAVSLLVLSGNLYQLVFAWIATSLALHGLLVFYRERPAAVIAARKKFITGRIGDVCLVAAAFLMATAFGSSDIATILERARALAEGTSDMVSPGAGIAAAALLLAIAALLKSAQFPAHGWLPEVMETPTPVSALLHAGIINAGGFLVIRFADVMVLSPFSLHVLALVGGFTALFAAVVMLTHSSVKVSLAWSTVAQMGFMLLQCGFGAFALATLHIVAHSLYKAHAFLTSGSVVEIARASWVPDMKARPRPRQVLSSLVLALALYGVLGSLFLPLSDSRSLAVLCLGAILVMGLTLLIAQSMAGKPNAFVVGRTLVAASGATLAYFVLQAGVTWLMTPTLPPIPLPGAFDILMMGLAVTSFALVTILQILAPLWSHGPAWQTARIHLANGLYVNALFNRLVGAMKQPSPGQS